MVNERVVEVMIESMDKFANLTKMYIIVLFIAFVASITFTSVMVEKESNKQEE